MPQPIVMKKPVMPQLVNTRKAAEILGRSAATLKRWRAEGVARAELDRTARSG
jgi:predicted site-specific integrase-resolvase